MIDFINIKGVIEALLFVSDRPLPLPKIMEIAEIDEIAARNILEELKNEYIEQNRGFQLREIAGGYRLYTHPGYASYIEKLILTSDSRKLSQAALETLAIIAYKQPLTKNEISAIRGVNVDGVISSLLEKDLIKEAGREKTPGQPILYGTTKMFLEKFGLKDISDLPPLEEFEADEETKRQIVMNLTS
ncbi:MAG: SMC-Scp complex subunit ScpB [Actinobacteria bacterium]|nr:SMC-Scp complex subunit ScpB [Actinomycetota bacterium]